MRTKSEIRRRSQHPSILLSEAFLFILFASSLHAASELHKQVEGKTGPASSPVVNWASKDGKTVNASSAASISGSQISGVVGSNPFRLETLAGSINLQAGTSDEVKQMLMLPSLRSNGETTVVVVTPRLPLQQAMENIITQSGAEVVASLPPNSYIVRADVSAISSIAGNEEIYWVGRIPTELKLAPVLNTLLSKHASLQAEAANTADVAPDELVVSCYDMSLRDQLIPKLGEMGTTVIYSSTVAPIINIKVSNLTLANQIAAFPEVAFVEANQAVHTNLNTSNYLIHHAPFQHPNANFGLDVSLGMIDSGFAIDHRAFKGVYASGANVSGEGSFDDAFVDFSGHGTHVAGIMLSGWRAVNLLGMAPKSGRSQSAPFYAIRCGRSTQPRSIFNAGQAIDIMKGTNAKVVNCSFGSSGNSGTTSNAVNADSVIWQTGQTYVWAAGNDGPSVATIGSYASAKNVIAVGNINNGSLALENSSSRGPTGDGRSKPDIFAPGNPIVSASASNVYGAVAHGGTSMAAPHVAGVLGTFYSMYPAIQGQPHLAKALMRASADRKSDLPDFSGVLDSTNLHYSTTEGTLRYATYNADPRPYSYIYWDFDDLPAGMTEMVVVVTWTEPPAVVGASKAVLNDIDLYVDHNKNESAGNAGEWNSTSSSDNVEYIRIANPPSGSYRVKANKFSATSNYKLAAVVYCRMKPEDLPVLPRQLEAIGKTKVNFAKVGKDSIKLKALITTPPGFSPNGQLLDVTVGGISEAYLLDGKGRAVGSGGKLKVKMLSNQTAQLTLQMKGSLWESLETAGMTNSTVSNVPVSVAVNVNLANEIYSGYMHMTYKAKLGKSGSAK